MIVILPGEDSFRQFELPSPSTYSKIGSGLSALAPSPRVLPAAGSCELCVAGLDRCWQLFPNLVTHTTWNSKHDFNPDNSSVSLLRFSKSGIFRQQLYLDIIEQCFGTGLACDIDPIILPARYRFFLNSGAREWNSNSRPRLPPLNLNAHRLPLHHIILA